MELSLMTFTITEDVIKRKMDINKICKLASKYSIKAIDIMEMELKLYGLEKTKQALKDNNIKVSCLIAALPFMTGKEEVIQKKLVKSLEDAQSLGTDQIMIVPFSFFDVSKLKKMTLEEKRERLVKYFTLAVELAKKHNIQISVEDTPSIHLPLAKAEDCKYLLEQVPGLGLTYDTANMLPEGEDPIAFYRELKDYICHVHLKDVKYVKSSKRADQTRDGRYFTCCPWGEGVIPVAEIAELLQQDGIDCDAGIEYCHPQGEGMLEAHIQQMNRFARYWKQKPQTPDGTKQMRNGKVFGWAYIGAGIIAGQTANQIHKTGSHRIVTVYNRTFSKAETFASKYGAKPCRSIEEAVTAEGVEGVYIATTANNHYEAAKECLELGKAVLLEKPFTITKAEAEELVKLAREKNVYLAEAMWTWFSPVALQVKKWVQSEEVGKIKNIKLTYSMPIVKYVPRLADPNLAGGALIDCGIYPITYCYNLFGKPEKVECVGTLKGGVDMEEDVTMTFSDGMKVTAVISIERSKGLENLVITGENGTVKCFFYHAARKATLIRSSGQKIVFKGNGGYDNEFTLVAEEILNGQTESNYVPLQATLDNMEVLDECRRQMGLVYPFETNKE